MSVWVFITGMGCIQHGAKTKDTNEGLFTVHLTNSLTVSKAQESRAVLIGTNGWARLVECKCSKSYWIISEFTHFVRLFGVSIFCFSFLYLCLWFLSIAMQLFFGSGAICDHKKNPHSFTQRAGWFTKRSHILYVHYLYLPREFHFPFHNFWFIVSRKQNRKPNNVRWCSELSHAMILKRHLHTCLS